MTQPFRRILVPTDFSPLALHAAHYARHVATLGNSEVHVVHAVTGFETMPGVPTPRTGAPPPAGPEVDTVHASLSDFVAACFGGLEPAPRQDVLLGPPADTITHYAQQHEINLIVIGTHARSLVERMIVGSVSKAVLERAVCPVLMVPVADVPADEDARPATPPAAD
jgi:nucleotide-binding universal stress UspA family protein